MAVTSAQVWGWQMAPWWELRKGAMPITWQGGEPESGQRPDPLTLKGINQGPMRTVLIPSGGNASHWGRFVKVLPPQGGDTEDHAAISSWWPRTETTSLITLDLLLLTSAEFTANSHVASGNENHFII